MAAVAAGSPAGFDLGAAISSAMDGPSPSESTSTSSEAPQETSAPSETAPVTEQGPPVENVQPESTEQTAPTTEAAPADPATPYKLTEDGSSYMIPKADWEGLNGVREYATQVQQYFPTAADAQVAQTEQAMLRAITSDYLQGGDEDIDAVLGWLAGNDANDPQYRATSQQRFVKLAERMPDVLRSVNPEAHTNLTRSMMQPHIEAAYQRASQEGNLSDPNDPLLKAAQWMDFTINGDYRHPDPAIAQQYGVKHLQKYDPRQAEQQRFEAEKQALEQREKALFDHYWKGYDKSSLNGAKWTQFDAEIDRTLAPVKPLYEAEVYDAIRDRIASNVKQKLQQDQNWARMHNQEYAALSNEFRAALKAGKNADVLKGRSQYYVNDFLQRARQYIPALAKPILDKAAKSPAQQQQQTKPPQKTQPPAGPSRDANGRYTPQSQTERYDSLQDNPKWRAMFQ